MATLPPFGTVRIQAPQGRELQDKAREVAIRNTRRAVSKMSRDFKSSVNSGDLRFTGPNHHEIEKIKIEYTETKTKLFSRKKVSKTKSMSLDRYVDKLMREIPNTTMAKDLSESDLKEFRDKFTVLVHFQARKMIKAEGLLARKNR